MSLQRNGHKSQETTSNLQCVILHFRIQTFLPSKSRFLSFLLFLGQNDPPPPPGRPSDHAVSGD